MKPNMLTLKKAVDYLWRTRKIKVTRQAVYDFAQKHTLQCERIDGPKRPVLFLIPTRLLDTYTPSKHHQDAAHKRHSQAA